MYLIFFNIKIFFNYFLNLCTYLKFGSCFRTKVVIGFGTLKISKANKRENIFEFYSDSIILRIILEVLL